MGDAEASGLLAGTFPMPVQSELYRGGLASDSIARNLPFNPRFNRMLRRPRSLRFEILSGVLVLLLSASRAQADSKDAPKVVVAWPSGPLEARISFDRTIDLTLGTSVIGKSIHFDLHQRALEAWRSQGLPPFTPPLGTLNIAAAKLDPERRTLILTTDPHPREAVYLLDASASQIPGTRLTPTGVPPALSGPIAYDLNGVSVSWAAGDGEAENAWEGWWPELDPQTSRRMTLNSCEHDRGFALLNQSGRATLESLVVLPKGRIVLKFVCNKPMDVSLNGEAPGAQDRAQAEFVLESTGDPSALLITVRTELAEQPFSLQATYRTEKDQEDQVLSRDHLILPWVPPTPASSLPAPTPPPFRLTGGDRDRGENLFHGDRAKCSGCHKVRGKGGSVGPDLSNLADLGIEDLFRAIAEPSASIHPDFHAYTVALKDGRVVVGIVRAEGAEKIRVTDSDAKMAEIPRSEIEELRSSGTSIMPVGLVGAIGEQETRDILAYLLSSTPQRATSLKPPEQGQR